MKKILFLLFVTNLQAESYLVPESISWDELKVIQEDVVLNLEEDYLLSPQCFKDTGSLSSLKKIDYLQTILWNTYIWREHLMPDGLKCYAIIQNYGKQNEKIDVLTPFESEVLLTASKGIGFEAKGFYEYSKQINEHNYQIKMRKENAPKKTVLNPVELKDEHVKTEEGYTILKFPHMNFETPINQSTGTLTANRARTSITHDQTDDFPYYAVGDLTSVYQACSDGSPTRQATGFLISKNVALTNAHNFTACGYAIFSFINMASHSHNGALPISHYGSVSAANVILSPEYLTNQQPYAEPDDYAVQRYYASFTAPLYIALTDDLSLATTDVIEAVGYPGQDIPVNYGMWEYSGNYIASSGYQNLDDIVSASQRFVDFGSNQVEGGLSGSPTFRNSENLAFGMVTIGIDDGGGKGIVNGFTTDQFFDIVSWVLWDPTVTIEFPVIPVPGETYNLTEIPDFEASVDAIQRMKIDGSISRGPSNLGDLIEWESNVDGSIGNGALLTSEELKANLSGGTHFITAKIDSQGQQGEASVFINIVKPIGGFNSDEFCILDLASGSNTCSIDVSWQVTDSTSTPVVWNETDNTQFATGNSGTQSISVTKTGTELKLYPSDERIILLDTTNIEAKVPTGNLSIANNVCSLEPSPFAPDGSQRDPKATPAGCGVELTWTNVQWSSPSIFYRIGNGSWQHLYQIPCNLEGEVCSDSIDTNILIPELVPVTGAEFKLLQFDIANAGELSGPVSANGYRFADAYEFDDGNLQGAEHLAPGPTLTTDAVLGVAQHNHNFHDRSGSTLGEDIDSVQIDGNAYEGQTMIARVFNMAPGLNVNMNVMCAGTKTASNDVTGKAQPGLWPFKNSPVLSPGSPPSGEAILRFVAKSGETYTDSIEGTVELNCFRNRIVIERDTGTPSENLTYSVVVNVENTNVPILNQVYTVCGNNYCPRLLGSNFPADAWVSIRENIPGSSEMVQYGGNLIYTRTPFSNQDRLQFPIPEPNVQAKFRSPGLCFKVMSLAGASNELCYVRPVTADQPPILGSAVEGYPGQDNYYDAFVTNTSIPQIKIWGNSWKQIDHSYNITPNTVLEFEFNSNKQEAEINGIGFIKSGQSSMPSSQFWQVSGTQSYGNQQYHDYVNGSGFKLYTIPIGQFMIGTVQKMVFVADEDERVGQNSIFRKMTLKEVSTAIPPTLNSVGTYCPNEYDCVIMRGHDFPGDAYVSVRENVPGSSELAQYGGNLIYSRVPSNGEERLIFPIPEPLRQQKFRNPGLCFKVVASTGSSNEICRTGPASPGPQTLLGETVEQYRPGIEDLQYDAFNSADHSSVPHIMLWGNSWKQIDHNYTVTQDTILEFEFISYEQEAQINGIGFLKSGQTQVPTNQFWQVYGTESFGHQSNNNYVSNGQYKRYNIPIGQYFTGPISKMVFAADEDGTRVGQHVVFRSMKLLESTSIDEYDNVPAQRPYDDDVSTRGVTWQSSDVEHLHNFHDEFDNDWTIYFANGPTKFSTELLGSNADTSFTLFEWTSWEYDTSGAGEYKNVTEVLRANDVRAGPSEIIVSPSVSTVYALRTYPRLGAYGNGSDYKLKIEVLPQASPDQYDNVPSQRAYDDDVRERAVSWLGSDTVHDHNFHDLGDEDWTLVYVPAGIVQFKTQLIGANSDTRMYVYKWISAAPHPSGDGTYINVVDEFVAQDTSVAASEVTVTATEPTFYAVKVDSRLNRAGADTAYKLFIETF